MPTVKNAVTYLINLPDFINILIIVAIAASSFFISRWLSGFVTRLIARIASKGNAELSNVIVTSLYKQFYVFFVLLGLLVALRITPYVYFNHDLWLVIIKIYRSALIFIAAWCIFDLESSSNLFAVFITDRINTNINPAMLSFVSKLLRFATAIIALLIIFQEWNYSISGLLTGFGLSGLAFALAAQGILSNIFGGTVILADKPFVVGDWIKTGEIEGIVEDMNFWSVKIRTFTRAVVTVPNISLVNNPVINLSRMGKRRVAFNIGIKPDTPSDKIKICTASVQNLLDSNGEIEKETAIAAFDGISSGCLNIAVLYFVETMDYTVYMRVKEKIYLDTIKILNDTGIKMAYPTFMTDLDRNKN